MPQTAVSQRLADVLSLPQDNTMKIAMLSKAVEILGDDGLAKALEDWYTQQTAPGAAAPPASIEEAKNRVGIGTAEEAKEKFGDLPETATGGPVDEVAAGNEPDGGREKAGQGALSTT